MFHSQIRSSVSRICWQLSPHVRCQAIAAATCSTVPTVLSVTTCPVQHLCHKPLHTSTWLAKKKSKKEKKSSKSSSKSTDEDDLDVEDLPQSPEELIDLEELKASYTKYVSNMRRDFASQLCLRTNQASFTNFPVQLDNGKMVNLQYLGQVSMKTPNMVHINLASNPQYIHLVRDALLNSALNVNPRIEGSSIFMDTPRVTREHREKLSKSAKALADDYKVKIRNTQNSKLKLAKAGETIFGKDAMKRLQDDILKAGKAYSKEIDDAVKIKQKELLSDG